ncbi:predicted protein [Thalassiosira pseudonana CCMP1335]|uniref:Clathrin light chain n=1 Tax=Thalassiosira pseudonana TaxID=35128 RepID=B8LCW8_THAPS|nr:predicted protein [Thalassiosira pseudonana CCMP1335]EED86837.1 predicted protein [Thalassiosira pseudonana CCMP1335]
MDEQTNEFFNPPEADFTGGFASPPADDSQIGDVYYGDEQTGEFFNPPAAVDEPAAATGGEADGNGHAIILGEAPPVDAADASMGFAAAASNTNTLIEDVDDEDDADPAASAAWFPPNPRPWPNGTTNDENAAKASQLEAAQNEIAAFQAEREKRRESRMAKNRSDEQDKLEAIEADLENDNSWQRVVKMVELNQDGGEGSADTGRMKDVLVLLKNEPGRADALTV